MKKQNHTSHFTHRTSQNGITLIALIITIIVMLILVGVTINVALNGGLFQKAEYASEQMQIKADEEELLSAVVASIGNDGKLGNIVLPAGWDKLEDGNYKSPKDNIFKVHPNGKIEYIGKYTGGGSGGNTPVAFTWSSVNLGNVDTSAEYKGYIQPLNMTVIVSFTEDGRVLMHEGEHVTEIDATKPDNIDDTTGNLSFLVKINGADTNVEVLMKDNDPNIYANIGGLEALGPITYVKQGKTIYSNEEVLKMTGGTNTGTYTGTWTVLERGADGNSTKLVSTSDVTSCTLGEYDNLEKSISDYKNAVSILNTSAQQATGITSARSINVEDICSVIGNDFIGAGNSEYGKVYNYYYNADEQKVYSKYKMEDGNWSTPNNTGYSSQTFVDDNGNTVVVDSENDNVTLTYTYYYYDLTEDLKAEIGTLATGYYWLASPCVDCDSYDANFYVRYVDDGSIDYNDLFYSNGYAYDDSSGVRAVVSISGL